MHGNGGPSGSELDGRGEDTGRLLQATIGTCINVERCMEIHHRLMSCTRSEKAIVKC